MDATISKKEAIRKLWQKGIVRWKLDDGQLDLYNTVEKAPNKVITFLCSRRFGKTFTLAVIAIETCLRKPNSTVKFLCPTQKQVKTTLVPIVNEIISDCPKNMRPTHLVNEGIFKFTNGSQIQFAGNDGGRVDNLRGVAANLCIIDEAGFCDNLGYAVRSVLLPTTITTEGKIILSSTPPSSPGHEFADFVKAAEYDKTLIKKTIYDNKRLSPSEVYLLIETYKGVNHPEFRREYLCEMETDPERAVLPEFTPDLEKRIVKEMPRPQKFDYYVSGDFGFKDFTAFLFSYFDFKNNAVVIEDEILVNKATTLEIANKIKEKEKTLLLNPLTHEQQTPYLRVCDNNLFIINDLHKLHGLTFLATQKDDKAAAINQTRILLEAGRIIINPRCENLIRHMKASWKKNKREFERTAENGHADLLDALIYLIRNVNWNKNPYPAGFGLDPQNMHINKPQTGNTFGEQLQKLYKIKKSL